MRKYILFALVAILTVVSSAGLWAEDWVDVTPESRILVLPVLNTAFEDKDKFYGMNSDLSYNLQSFLTFSLDVMSDFDVVKPNQDELYGNYTLESVYNGTGDTLEGKVNLDVMKKAGKEYGAELVMAAQVLSTWVLVDGLKNTLKAEVSFVLLDVNSGQITYNKVLQGEDSFTYDSKKSKQKAGNAGDMSIGGGKISFAELRQDPMKFGGMVTGFPFLDISRQLGLELRR